jgi:hypothetical protein
VWHNMVYKTMKDRLDEMKPDDPPYRDRYPELRELKKYYALDKGVPPEGNRVVRNVVQARGKPLEQWLRIRGRATPEMIEVKDNYAAEDVGFVDGEKGRWQLRDDSPVWKTGFQKIPVEKIGLQRPVR